MLPLLPTTYLGPVQYYARLYAEPAVEEERCESFVKQTYRNRCLIASANGPLALTVPVVHTGGNQLIRDVRISSQGNWQKLHWAALVSAYDNSPYFEYYADDFRPFYERSFQYLVDFNAALRQTVCDLLSLHTEVRPTTAFRRITDGYDDRVLISPKADWRQDPFFRPVPYYQVFSQKFGFLPNLSIVDLLFNLGPEARRVLLCSRPIAAQAKNS